MQEKASVPVIRFAGFVGDWEQRKFESIAGRASSISDNPGLPRVEYEDIISDIGQLNKDVNLKESSKPGIEFHEGDVLYGKLRPYLQNWLLPSFSGLAVGDFWVLQPQNAGSSFLYRLIQSQKFDEVANQSTGTKMPRADWKLVSKTVFAIPASIDEQREIGNFFRHLDNLITLHQNKYSQLCNVKKSMLEKMFPKEGAAVPEIRFAGFAGDWEQRKLGDDLIAVQTGTNKLGSEQGKGTPLLKMGNIQRGYFSLDRLEYLSDLDTVEPENIAYYGDFFFNTRNTLELVGKGATWIGDSGKYVFNSNIARFKLRNIDTIFFNYLYNTQAMIDQVHARAMGTTSVAAIYPQSLNSIEYRIPSVDEQNVIGDFLLKLDNLITLHQRKLDRLQNIKKACLEKMFI